MNILGKIKDYAGNGLIETAYYSLFTGAGAVVVATVAPPLLESAKNVMPVATAAAVSSFGFKVVVFGLTKGSGYVSTKCCCPSLKVLKLARELFYEGGTFFVFSSLSFFGTLATLSLTHATNYVTDPKIKALFIVVDGGAVYLLSKGTAKLVDHCCTPKIVDQAMELPIV